MVIRKEYLEKLKEWRDCNIIKVITGIRRCGKSTLLSQYRDYLLSEGVNEKRVLSINFEDLEYEELFDYKKLYEYIVDRLDDNDTTYIFLDEVQNVKYFEKAVDSLFIKSNVDIYITGSNSYMLSSDLATLLTGRYVEISMLPFSFKEYLSIRPNDNIEKKFAEYMKYGGFPYIAEMQGAEGKIDDYIEGIYNTVIVRDIEDRWILRGNGSTSVNVTDIPLLKNIAKYLSSIVGNPVSARSIANYLTSSGQKISPNTVSNHLEALVESFIFYPSERIDIAGKQLLRSNKKYYIVDLCIRNHILPRRKYDLGFSLENIVFFELKRRGYKVCTGKIQENEVDFVVQKSATIAYFQVTADMTSEETFEREIKPLRAINDNYEKCILTLDKFTEGNYDGIIVKNIIDWLVEE